jgi:hypothetical protein
MVSFFLRQSTTWSGDAGLRQNTTLWRLSFQYAFSILRELCLWCDRFSRENHLAYLCIKRNMPPKSINCRCRANCFANSISVALVPTKICHSTMAAGTTPGQSLITRSTSSAMCDVPPRIRMLTDFCCRHSLTYISLLPLTWEVKFENYLFPHYDFFHLPFAQQ